MTRQIAPIAKHIVPNIMKIWIRDVSGIENLPKEEPFILAPNHCSYIEHPMIGSIVIPKLNRKLCILAKKEHFEDAAENFWHKLWSKYITYVPIDRSKGEKALEVVESELKKGGMVLMYPEGTRTLNGKIQKGKTGIARLVLGAKVPVVPVGFKGTFEILPKNKRFPRFKRASISFGKPIHFDGYYNKQISRELLREITDKIMKEIASLSGQVYDAK